MSELIKGDLASSFANQLKNWRGRALAAHPNDREMRQSFLDGIARVLMEELLVSTEAGMDAAERWEEMGRRAYNALVEPQQQPPETKTAAPPGSG